MQEEIFPLVDAEGNVVGQASRSECHSGSKLLHPVIHLHVFNSKGELYLQYRSKTKDIQPDKWDSSVGGHIDLGELPTEAAHREAREEIGLHNLTIYYIQKYIIETNVERELTYCYYAQTDDVPVVDNKEVEAGRFWTIEEVKAELGKDIFTPNFELDFNHFLHEGVGNLNKNIK